MKVTMTIDEDVRAWRAPTTESKELLESMDMIQRGVWLAYLKQNSFVRRSVEYVHVRIYLEQNGPTPRGTELTIKLADKADGMDWARKITDRLDNREPDAHWRYAWSTEGVTLFVCSKIKELLDTQKRSYEAAAKLLNLEVRQ